MKKLLILLLTLTGAQAYCQNSLSITASPDGDGFTTDTRTITADANKFKLNAGAVLKSFKLQWPGWANGHQLVITAAGAGFAPGQLNSITDNAAHTLTFDQDISEKEITATDVTAAGSVLYLKFTLTKGTPVANPQANANSNNTNNANNAPTATPTKVTITYTDDQNITSPPSTFPNAQNSGSITVKSTVKSIKSFSISATGLAAGHSLIISQVATANQDTYTTGTKVETWTDLINHTITIQEDKGDGSPKISVASVTFAQTANPSSSNANTSTLTSPQSAINIAYYTHTNYGYVDPKDPNTVHLFFDMFGNNLFETVPPGIPNHNYVVHIVYPGYSNQSDDITYSVKQTGGSPNNGALLFANTGILSSLTSTFQDKAINQNSSGNPYNVWKVKDLYLGNSHDDIAFTITTSIIGDDNKATTGDLVSYTIKMSSIYHGSFDVGLINSSLRNPTYALTAAPDGSSNQVVKTTNDGKRGMVSVMASFYTSPIVVLEKYVFGVKNIPDFKLTGRDFLDDHKIYERFYPTIGVSVNETAFDNLFYGFNWEIARGLSIFGGRHWGKINTFAMPGYVDGQTITQAQYNYYSNTRWSTAWAYGLKVDILVVTNLIGSGAK